MHAPDETGPDGPLVRISGCAPLCVDVSLGSEDHRRWVNRRISPPGIPSYHGLSGIRCALPCVMNISPPPAWTIAASREGRYRLRGHPGGRGARDSRFRASLPTACTVTRALRWILLAITLIPVLPALAQGPEDGMPVIAIDELESQTLRAPVEFQVSPDAGAADIAPRDLPAEAFRPLMNRDVNRGITGADHWLRVRLSNASGDAAQSWVLHHETSYLDHLTVYYADDGEPLKRAALSDREPFHARPFNHRTLAFAHDTPAGGHTDLYLQLGFDKADSLTLNLQLTRTDLFHDATRVQSLIFGAFYGVMSAFVLIAILFAVILRRSVYLLYAAFLVVSMVMWALLNGLAYQYLWPGSTYLHNEGFHIVYLLVAITALQFSRRFLKTQEFFPRIDCGLRIAQWIFAAGILLRLAGVHMPVLMLSFIALTLLVLLSVLGLMAYRRGMRYARWYSIAWLVYGVGLGFSVLSAGTSLLEWGMTPLIFAQAGSAVEAAFLLVALGERLLDWDHARRRALRIAHQDPLTGLGNRRALDVAFDALEERASARGMPVFLAFIDLDHFKIINDRYGHEAGDAVLRHFARLLRSVCRPDDVLIRYGGEEFAIFIQAPYPEDAEEVLERIRIEFAREPTTFQGVELTHTLTAGIALALSPDTALDRADAIRRADTALYEGKRQGRNRCVMDAERTGARP